MGSNCDKNSFNVNDDYDNSIVKKQPKCFINPESYRRQLLAQMNDRKERELRSRQRKIEERKKYDEEQNKYYYFEREGGGAPMRDSFGHIIANRALQLQNSSNKLRAGEVETF